MEMGVQTTASNNEQRGRPFLPNTLKSIDKPKLKKSCSLS